MTNIKPILSFENVDKIYEKGGKNVQALKNISFNLNQGTTTLINGPSGAGKTTLIYLAGLLKKPSNGDIIINGLKTSDLDQKERSKFIRENIGFIFRRFNLLPHLSILENVMMPMQSRDSGKARELLQKVEINNCKRFPRDLTFEEEQKVALARALSNEPVLILADEATGELNTEQSHNFIRILNQLDDVAILLTSDHNFSDGLFNQKFELDYGIMNTIF